MVPTNFNDLFICFSLPFIQMSPPHREKLSVSLLQYKKNVVKHLFDFQYFTLWSAGQTFNQSLFLISVIQHYLARDYWACAWLLSLG